MKRLYLNSERECWRWRRLSERIKTSRIRQQRRKIVSRWMDAHLRGKESVYGVCVFIRTDWTNDLIRFGYNERLIMSAFWATANVSACVARENFASSVNVLMHPFNEEREKKRSDLSYLTPFIISQHSDGYSMRWENQFVLNMVECGADESSCW